MAVTLLFVVLRRHIHLHFTSQLHHVASHLHKNESHTSTSVSTFSSISAIDCTVVYYSHHVVITLQTKAQPNTHITCGCRFVVRYVYIYINICISCKCIHIHDIPCIISNQRSGIRDCGDESNFAM